MSHILVWQMIKIDKELDKNWLYLQSCPYNSLLFFTFINDKKMSFCKGIFYMVSMNFCERPVVKNLNKVPKNSIVLLNLSCRNINVQKTLDYTLNYEISFLTLSSFLNLLHFHPSSTSIYLLLSIFFCQ